MSASTARYQFYDFTYCAIQTSDGAGTPSIVTTQLFYPNKVVPSSNEIDIKFEGGGAVRHVYLNNEFSVTIDQDCLDINALSVIFAKSKSTSLTGTPFSTEFTPMGETTEGAGVSCGLVCKAPAIKNVAGVETVVTLVLWVPVGLLTVVKQPGFTTNAKMETPQFKLSGTRSSVNIIGGSITGAPSGGFMYAVGE
jgi:hypothetical protein